MIFSIGISCLCVARKFLGKNNYTCACVQMNYPKLKSGTIIRIKWALNQDPFTRTHIGKAGLIFKNLTEEDEEFSSKNLYRVIMETGKLYTFHYLDFEILEE